MYEIICEWNLRNSVKTCYFNTTATNTGLRKDACKLLENNLQRDLLYLACRHHIYEIMLRTAFENKIKGTSEPVVPLFKKFSEFWSKIDKVRFLLEMEEEKINFAF